MRHGNYNLFPFFTWLSRAKLFAIPCVLSPLPPYLIYLMPRLGKFDASSSSIEQSPHAPHLIRRLISPPSNLAFTTGEIRHKHITFAYICEICQFNATAGPGTLKLAQGTQDVYISDAKPLRFTQTTHSFLLFLKLQNEILCICFNGDCCGDWRAGSIHWPRNQPL